MLSRIMYILHGMLTIWRVTTVLGAKYWIIGVGLIGILAETLVVMLKRDGKEWKWFQPVLLIYLLMEIPCLWLLELEKISQVQIQYNSSFVILGDLIQASQRNVNIGTISISSDWWTIILEQSMIVLIIFARWLMPRGEMTREQLSGLLLYYLGTASDILDFFSVLAEDDILMLDMGFVFTILIFWSWSMFQFIFVSTMTANSPQNDDGDDLQEGKTNPKSDIFPLEEGKPEKLSIFASFTKRVKVFIESEAWTIFTSLVMQDGPFALVRLICLTYWRITTYTNYFFTLKNILIVSLQVYRLVAVYHQHQEHKKTEEVKQREDRTRKWKLSVLKATAFKHIKTTGIGKVSSSISMPKGLAEEHNSRERDILASYIKNTGFNSYTSDLSLVDVVI